jgi:outer membrane protein assembly factor BamB
VKLNTQFNGEELTMDPEIIKYRYDKLYEGTVGVENSPVIYRNLLIFADNAGLLQCLDINTLKPLWIANLEDDTDSSIVLEESDEGVFIYTANEVDIRCYNKNVWSADSSIRKFNVLTGELIWEKNYNSFYNSNIINGGVLATPILGKNDIDNMVIYNIAKTGTPYGGKMVALDKETGNEIWTKDLEFYSWSSPVDFLGSDGKTYMVYCDFGGFIYLMDPQNGEVLDKVSLGANVEGSPSIYNDTIVIGSYAKKIFGLKIK